MEDLATELLTKIFNKVDFKSKLNLTLVCRRFRDIIGGSHDLMSDFKISIDLRNVDWAKKIQRRGDFIRDLCLKSLLESNRVYQHLIIRSFRDQYLIEIMAKFSPHLKTWEIHGSINKGPLVIIIRELHALEDAKLNPMIYDDISSEKYDGSKMCPNLKHLKTENDLNIYVNFFKQSVKKLETFEINGYKLYDLYDPVNLQGFLKLQPLLKSMKFHCFHATKLFETDFSGDLTFKLEQFETKDLALSTDSSRTNFLNFLLSQTKLKSLNLQSTDWDTTWTSNQDILFAALLKLESLENLEVNLTKCDFIDPSKVFDRINPTIKKFVFKNTDPDMEPISETMILDHLVHSMPNLRYLDFVTFHAASSTDLNCLNQLEYLEDLTIRDCEYDAVEDIKLPALRKLKLCSYIEDEEIEEDENYTESWVEFFENHKGLQDLTFNLEFTEEILLALFENLENLKRLELTISQTELAEIILRDYKKCKQLEFLKISVEPPPNSKYVEKSDEFVKMFCGDDNFSFQLCGEYSQCMEFKKSDFE